MNFKYDVSVDAGPAETSYTDKSIVLTPGKVEQLSITFPAGCMGLVGLRILRGLFQVWPLTSTDWYIADDFTIVIPCSQIIKDGADRFRIEVYNEDTKYPHTLHVDFSIILPDTISERILELLNERLPAGIENLIAAGFGIQGDVGETIEIMRDELIPILQASLQAQQKLLERDYSDMSMKELLNF